MNPKQQILLVQAHREYTELNKEIPTDDQSFFTKEGVLTIAEEVVLPRNFPRGRVQGFATIAWSPLLWYLRAYGNLLHIPIQSVDWYFWNKLTQST